MCVKIEYLLQIYKIILNQQHYFCAITPKYVYPYILECEPGTVR